MDPIEEAIKEIESLDPQETFSYAEIARKYGVVRTALMRRHKELPVSPRLNYLTRNKRMSFQSI
jgi:hypothetical protein